MNQRQKESELDEKIANYKIYLKSDPENSILWMSLGDLYHQAGRCDDAISCYERCLSDLLNSHLALGKLASVMISCHRFKVAEEKLRELIYFKGERDPALLHNLGIALFYQDQWHEAAQSFHLAHTLGLNVAKNFAYLSRCYHHEGKMKEAINACTEWLQLEPSPEARGYLAFLEMDNNNMARANERALGVLAEEPDNIDALIVTGNSGLEQQDMSNALLRFSKILQQQPNHSRAWLGLGLVFLYQQRHTEAIDALEKASNLMPKNPGTIVALGWAHLASKNAQASEHTFYRAIRVNPNFAESHAGLAVALALQNKIDKAQEALRISTRLDRNNYSGALAKTIILKLQGKEKLATDLMAKLFQQTIPNDTTPLINHVLTYLSKTQLTSAKPKQ